MSKIEDKGGLTVDEVLDEFPGPLHYKMKARWDFYKSRLSTADWLEFSHGTI